MSYCVQSVFSDDGCLIVCRSALTTDVLLCEIGADDGCLIVCRSVLTTDVLLCVDRR